MAMQLQQQVERVLPKEMQGAPSIPDKMQGLDAKNTHAQHTARSTEGFKVVRGATAAATTSCMHSRCRLRARMH
jgi:hypothetical protein